MDANKHKLIFGEEVFEVTGYVMEVLNEIMKMFFCNLFDNLAVIRVYSRPFAVLSYVNSYKYKSLIDKILHPANPVILSENNSVKGYSK